MIGLIRKMLELDKHYGVSDAVDIAKGKHKMVTKLSDFKLGLDQSKRKRYARSSN